MSESSERIFQDKVLQIALMNGWKYHHIVPREVRGRWLSDSPGFPDLVLAHKTRGFILAELKSATGKVTANQIEWLATANGHTVETTIWRPENLLDIAARLGRRP